MECLFCKKNLSSKYNLSYHQKTNKKCLSIQEVENNNVIEVKLSTCDFCNKSFTSQNLKVHLSICKLKIKHDNKKNLEKENEKKIEELKKENEKKINEIKKENEKKIDEIKKDYEKKLKKQKKLLQLKNIEICKLQKELEVKDEIYDDEHKTIKTIALQPRTNTNNNNNTNIIGNLNLDDTERIKNAIETNFTADDILDGQKGLANFAVRNILKDEHGNLLYACTDSSRKMFKFRNLDGHIIKDVNTQKLTDAFVLCDIKGITNSKTQQFWTNEDGTQDNNKYQAISVPAAEIMNLKYNNGTFRDHMVNLTT